MLYLSARIESPGLNPGDGLQYKFRQRIKMRIKQFIKQETVLIIAAILAVISMFFVHPDAQYADYIDLRTLAILFSLMAVMAGLRQQGVFDKMCQTLLAHTRNILQLIFVLVGMCFFGSMVITNDVALLTFVPFTFVVLKKLDANACATLAVPIVCMQTIAANLGSMLTPIGNPQNLYLYSKSGMSMGSFIALMLPYSLLSLILLIIWIAAFSHKQKIKYACTFETVNANAPNQKIVITDAVFFLICLLVVFRVLHYAIAFGVVLICNLFMDRNALKRVDYSLLLTFVAFFIFIGNLGRIPAFSEWLQNILDGREVLVSVLASQVTSNVPAALLLSGFTTQTEGLIIGTNLGGLGTLIASMASLISYRQIARELPDKKGRYFGLFTVSNVIFLALLLLLWWVI